ncbi:hypothetical protein B0H12DRAFT_1091627 [Mycena haematopus]|nr:hypothetical protein B0H12DRAFT_1091627 [Mycena haematopus]
MRLTHSTEESRGIDPVVLTPPQNIPVVTIRNIVPGYKARRLGLKTLTLRGMWRAANPNDGEPSIDALRTLHAQLREETEESLAARPYCSPETGTTALVGSFLQAEPGVPVLVAVGGARVLMGGRYDHDD